MQIPYIILTLSLSCLFSWWDRTKVQSICHRLLPSFLLRLPSFFSFLLWLPSVASFFDFFPSIYPSFLPSFLFSTKLFSNFLIYLWISAMRRVSQCYPHQLFHPPPSSSPLIYSFIPFLIFLHFFVPLFFLMECKILWTLNRPFSCALCLKSSIIPINIVVHDTFLFFQFIWVYCHSHM